MKREMKITHTHIFNDFRYNENKLETQLKIVLGRTYKYHTPFDAAIYRLMPTKALNYKLHSSFT
jgi:hypothetical protein